jgi:hypothetical protein
MYHFVYIREMYRITGSKGTWMRDRVRLRHINMLRGMGFYSVMKR